jgi:hypothetical protein
MKYVRSMPVTILRGDKKHLPVFLKTISPRQGRTLEAFFSVAISIAAS